MFQMEKGLTFSFPSGMELEPLNVENKNYSVIISPNLDDIFASESDPKYDQFLADVWVGVILTLIVLSCVCCMCSCLLYHKFQQWKRSILESQNVTNVESGNSECESLPSYTIASGLPSYTEALEQLKQVKELTKINTVVPIHNPDEIWIPHTPPTPTTRISVEELLEMYRTANQEVKS